MNFGTAAALNFCHGISSADRMGLCPHLLEKIPHYQADLRSACAVSDFHNADARPLKRNLLDLIPYFSVGADIMSATLVFKDRNGIAPSVGDQEVASFTVDGSISVLGAPVPG